MLFRVICFVLLTISNYYTFKGSIVLALKRPDIASDIEKMPDIMFMGNTSLYLAIFVNALLLLNIIYNMFFSDD